jgi:nucleoside 2-deoxyribosyltransferase
MLREYTNKIIEAVDEGLLDPKDVILACLNYMSEADVKNMAEVNYFFEYEENEYPEDAVNGEHVDNFNWVGSRRHY